MAGKLSTSEKVMSIVASVATVAGAVFGVLWNNAVNVTIQVELPDGPTEIRAVDFPDAYAKLLEENASLKMMLAHEEDKLIEPVNAPVETQVPTTTQVITTNLEDRIIGVFEGKYMAGNGKYYMTNLSIYKDGEKLKALFDCWSDPDYPSVFLSGSWRCNVDYHANSDTYVINATNWVDKNDEWNMDSFTSCKLSEDGNSLSGMVRGSRYEGFTIHRISN